MKKALQYIGFAVLVFVLLTLWDLISGEGMNPASNAVHTLITSVIYLGFDFYQNMKKGAQ